MSVWNRNKIKEASSGFSKIKFWNLFLDASGLNYLTCIISNSWHFLPLIWKIVILKRNEAANCNINL